MSRRPGNGGSNGSRLLSASTLTQVVTVVAVISTFLFANGKLQSLQSDLAAAQSAEATLQAQIAAQAAEIRHLEHTTIPRIIQVIRQVVRDRLRNQSTHQSTHPRTLKVQLVSLRRPRYCWAARVTIYGTTGPDVIFGTKGPDVIAALGGNDAVFGEGGNDRLCGNHGKDTLVGDPGFDRADGGNGSDDCVAERQRRCENT